MSVGKRQIFEELEEIIEDSDDEEVNLTILSNNCILREQCCICGLIGKFCDSPLWFFLDHSFRYPVCEDCAKEHEPQKGLVDCVIAMNSAFFSGYGLEEDSGSEPETPSPRSQDAKRIRDWRERINAMQKELRHLSNQLNGRESGVTF